MVNTVNAAGNELKYFSIENGPDERDDHFIQTSRLANPDLKVAISPQKCRHKTLTDAGDLFI